MYVIILNLGFLQLEIFTSVTIYNSSASTATTKECLQRSEITINIYKNFLFIVFI